MAVQSGKSERKLCEVMIVSKNGWFTKEEAYSSGLPIYIQEGDSPGHWTHEPYVHAVLLTKTRCAQLKMPTLHHGLESPAALRQFRGSWYLPLYDRTSVFVSGELPYDILQVGEIMGEEHITRVMR